MLWSDARAAVRHAHPDERPLPARSNRDPPAWRGVAQGVGQQVAEDPLHLADVGLDRLGSVPQAAAALKRAQADATALITRPPPVTPTPPPEVKPPGGKQVVKQETRSGLSATETKAVLSEIESVLREDVEVDISYTIFGDR